MEPISPSRAARQVAQARTADIADGELRRRGGFLTTARQTRERESVEGRDIELADGHAQYRFTGYVTVTTDSREQLTSSCAAAEQAASQAGIELRLLYGAQDVAFALLASSGARALVRNLIPRVPAHVTTTRHLCAAYPLVSEAGLGHEGVLIGRDVLGGSFVYDPFVLYRQGVITNPNMVVFGQIGRGKSSFVKSYLWRQAVFGRRAWVIDPKGEYGPLAEAWGVAPVALRPGGPVRLNPLDTAEAVESGSEPGDEVMRRRVVLTSSLAVACLGRDLLPRARRDRRRGRGGHPVGGERRIDWDEPVGRDRRIGGDKWVDGDRWVDWDRRIGRKRPVGRDRRIGRERRVGWDRQVGWRAGMTGPGMPDAWAAGHRAPAPRLPAPKLPTPTPTPTPTPPAPTLPMVVDALLNPSSDASQALRTTRSVLMEDGRDVALELRRLIHGDLCGMFDGPNICYDLVRSNIRHFQ